MPHKSKRYTAPLVQTAVYWSTPESDGFGGRTFAEPTELACRWEDRQELFIDVEGQEKRSHAIVMLSQDVDLGGYLFLGTLAELSSAEEADPTIVADAREIRNFEKVPDRKGLNYVRRVWL